MRVTGSALLSIILGVALALAAEVPAPVQKAVERLARVLDVNAGAIEVVSYELVEWPDSSLGAPREGMGYLPVITPGYKVILAHDAQRYEYHTDLKDRVVLAAPAKEEPIHTGPPAADEPKPSTGPRPAIAAKCREDLAKRLKVKLEGVQVARVEATTFTDASLGLPRPGEVYAKVITPGFMVVASFKQLEYLYTASERAFRYGGPLEARKLSALYLEPVQDEPNLNGTLMAVTPAGTNPEVVLEGVSDYRGQADGSVIAKRRTSRSGHGLLYLAPGQLRDATVLASGLDFVDGAVSQDGTRWAAIVRPGLGAGWQLIIGTVPGRAEGEPVELPEGTPLRVYLHMPNPVVRVEKDGQQEHYELVEGAFTPVSFWPPATEETMLSKSESLVVSNVVLGGKPVTQVRRVWFTGDVTSRAEIRGLVTEEFIMSPDHRFVVLSGKKDGKRQGVTVDLVTGEVLLSVVSSAGPVRLRMPAAD